MKVLLLTNQHERCGIAEYGRDLTEQLKRWYEVETSDLISPWPWDVPVVIVNWHNGRLDVKARDVKVWQKKSKVIVLLHNSWEGIELGSEEEDILAAADVVVAHEPMQFKPEPKRFVYIKHGATLLRRDPRVDWRNIGTAGFDGPWKRMDLVKRVAEELGRHYSIPCWQKKKEIIWILATCGLNIFWHQPETLAPLLGQSGSVLMGVGAGRPMIISRCRKFRVLLDEYPEEFYVADTEKDVLDMARDIIWNIPDDKLRRPLRARADMAWETVGEQWHDLVESLVGVPV